MDNLEQLAKEYEDSVVYADKSVVYHAFIAGYKQAKLNENNMKNQQEKKEKIKWEIKYTNERIIVEGFTIEDAIEEFKRLNIIVEPKEIIISSFGMLHM